MDGPRFDLLAKNVATRRAAARGLAAALAAGLAAASPTLGQARKKHCRHDLTRCTVAAGPGRRKTVCVDTDTDPAHCGGCGRACAPPHALARCAGGICTIDACETGFADCDAKADTGCEVDLSSDNDHCGQCGTRCPVPRFLCTDGGCECVATRCDPIR